MLQIASFRIGRDGVQRGVTLLLGIMIALASGSNYVYSGYAPQLGSRLNLSSTQINLIGMAGNLGMYTSGPLWGKLIDNRGPRLALLFASGFQFIGYYGIRLFYNRSIVMDTIALGETRHISSAGLICLAVFMCMTGLGGTAGLGSGINTVAKSFPDSTRATATGLTIAGFGLSAFLFSTLSRSFFPGDISSFLLLLSIGTALPMLIGAFFLRPVKPRTADDAKVAESGWGRTASGYDTIPDEVDEEDMLDPKRSIPVVRVRTPSLDLDDQLARSTSLDFTRATSPQLHASRRRREGSHEMSPTRYGEEEQARLSLSTDGEEARILSNIDDPELGAVVRDISVPASIRTLGVNDVDVFGKAMMMKGDFWVITTILLLLSGTGLCWINNVGSVTLALISEGDPDYDLLQVAKYQAVQVSVISIWNCLGRVTMGLMSDFAKTRLHIRRIWFLPFSSILFIISQISAQRVHDVSSLWKVSACLGLAYGGMFSLLPIIVLEWFGLAHFAQNWGFVSIAPAIGGNISNFIFGRIYDSHVVSSARASNQMVGVINRSFEVVGNIMKRVGGGGMIPNDHSHDCLVGQQCYQTSFRITTLACSLALVLSVIAGIRRERESRIRARKGIQMKIDYASVPPSAIRDRTAVGEEGWDEETHGQAGR